MNIIAAWICTAGYAWSLPKLWADVEQHAKDLWLQRAYQAQNAAIEEKAKT